MIVKHTAERTLLQEAGHRLGNILKNACKLVAPGIALRDINDFVHEEITKAGDIPAFLNYTPSGASRPYPAAVCISINNEVVHGIPNEKNTVFAEGDIATLDAGLIHEGVVVDAARTVAVGRVGEEDKKLITAAREALASAIMQARAGYTTGDIGYAVENVAEKYGFSVPHELGGHGVGKGVHEPPFIPNYGTPSKGDKLKEGMVLAIEPIIIAGNNRVQLLNDGYTYVTKDGSKSAQFEETVIVTQNDPIVITRSDVQ